MAYIADRVAHDADAHIMEPPNWLRDHADPSIRDRIERPGYANELVQTGDAARYAELGSDQERIDAVFARLAERHRTEEFLANEDIDVMNRKNFAATGSFLADDRPRVLDLIGVRSQLVFNTFHNSRLYQWEHQPDLDLAYGTARAHNRGMVEFCSVDPRLLPTCYVPLVDFDRASAMAAEAIEMGAARCSSPPAARRVTRRRTSRSTRCGARPRRPGSRSCSTSAAPATSSTAPTSTTACPSPPTSTAARRTSAPSTTWRFPFPPMQTLATLIFDGVLDRFPTLRIGVIEQGCSWVPSWMKQMESAMDAFGRHEERLQKLSLRPSEFVERQVRVTPYPTEDIGWVTDQIGPNILLFNTDYPHVEGGRRPFERFEESLGDRSEDIRQRFYADNFVDLMGTAVSALA